MAARRVAWLRVLPRTVKVVPPPPCLSIGPVPAVDFRPCRCICESYFSKKFLPKKFSRWRGCSLSGFAMKTAGVFLPLLRPSRYKGTHGGRGSSKPHFFAGLIIEHCLAKPSPNKGEGLRVVCIRETLRDLKESAKLLICLLYTSPSPRDS